MHFIIVENLKSVKIPLSLEGVGPSAFHRGRDNPSLERVIVPGPIGGLFFLDDLVLSLCETSGTAGNKDTGTSPPCIEGSGTRAQSIVNHANNTCSMGFCQTSSNVTDPCLSVTTPDDNPSEDSSDSTSNIGLIVGVVVGGVVIIALAIYYTYRSTKESQRLSRPLKPSTAF